jgi:formylglycine-generating enzyme required for sulfatase activity
MNGARDGMVLLGGEFRMGTDGPCAYADDGEQPVHAVRLSPFWIDTTAVTNEAFETFVEDTGYVTDAERFGWSFVFAGLLPDDFEATRSVAQTPWWRQVFGASWFHPEGSHSGVDERSDHPVVHISWDDACAYARWCGKRLPSEAEWEYAARGGLEMQLFPWGNDLEPDGVHRMNVFQGTFPAHDTGADGYTGIAPVTAYEPNEFGLYNTTGNVWEWCADWYDPRYYVMSPQDDPPGPDHGTHRVMRGGSYLCHASYCRRYRVGARSGNGPDSSTGNLGFRCARNAQPGRR